MSLAGLLNSGPDKHYCTGVTVDEVVQILSNERRRTVIQMVHERGHWELGHMATEMARRQSGVETHEQVDRDARKRFYISLYQTHLEKLDDVGAVEWSNGIIKRGGNTEALAELSEIISERVKGE